MLVLIDNYDSFTYNLVHYFGKLGFEPNVYRNDELPAEKILNDRPQAIILSPGPCSPQQAGICTELVLKSKGLIPILGVCLGHQVIAEAFGGKIIRAPRPIHGKVKKVKHTNHPLFNRIPLEFPVTRYHSLIAEIQTLPSELEVIATSAEEGEENMIMALSHKTYPIFGVQFHPESIRTLDGLTIIENFLIISGLAKEGLEKTDIK